MRFKAVKEDSCKTCDRLIILAESATDEERKTYLQAEYDNHLRKVKAAEMNDDLHRAHVDPKIECVTYDLQKVLLLPRISINIVYYKRQLSMFNLSIHCGSKNKGYFYTCIETEGGRGAQDIISVLKKHINECIHREVETLILSSNSCVEQNRNIKICLLM